MLIFGKKSCVLGLPKVVTQQPSKMQAKKKLWFWHTLVAFFWQNVFIAGPTEQYRSKWGQGFHPNWAGLAMLFSRQNGSQDFFSL